MKLIFFRAAILLGLLLFFLQCDSNKNAWQYDKGRVHGTFYSITYQSSKNLKSEIEKVTAQVDLSLSTFKPESIISRINAGDTDVELDSLFLAVFDKAKEVWEITEGAFDMTVAPLVNAWGFGYSPEKEIPSGRVDSLLNLVGFDKIVREGFRVKSDVRGIKLDASAIAKGFSVDRVADFLESQGIENYMVEIGGEVRVKGHNPKNKPWRIGIELPDDSANLKSERELQAVVALTHGALATSGNYRQFYYKDGKKYAHTIDPRTGYPVQHNLLSVSVFAADCMTADAFATAFMVLGLEKSIAIADSLPMLEAYFIYADNDSGFKTAMTTGFNTLIDK